MDIRQYAREEIERVRPGERRMKIALYKNLTYDSTTILQQPDWLPQGEREKYEMSGYARVSEWIDVEFPPITNDEVIQSALRSIDKAEQEVRERFQAELDRFKNMRANLLALPDRSQVAEHV